MLHLTNAARIAELEAALDNAIDYLKRLPCHPMTYATIEMAEVARRGVRPENSSAGNETALTTQRYAPNGMFLFGAAVTPQYVTVTTAAFQNPLSRESQIARLHDMLVCGLVLPPLAAASSSDAPEMRALLAQTAEPIAAASVGSRRPPGWKLS